MTRLLFVAAFLAFLSMPACAADTVPAATAASPAATAPAAPVLQLKELVLEKSKIAVRLGEIKAFGPFYQNKREALSPEVKRLEKVKAELALEGARVTEKCTLRTYRSKKEKAMAEAACTSYNDPYQAKLAQYQTDMKHLRGDYATLDRQEKDRAQQQQEQEVLLDEITKQIDKFAPTVPASKQKECITACGAGEASAAAACLDQCKAE